MLTSSHSSGHSLGAGLSMLVAAIIGPTIILDGQRESRDSRDSRVVGGRAWGDGDGDGLPASADVRQVRCYAYAPPCVLSLELARSLSSYVTSVVVADDMVPRFGISTTIEVKESLAALHREPGLIERVQIRRSGNLSTSGSARGASAGDGGGGGAAGATVDEDAKAWAQSTLDWVYSTHAQTKTYSKLFPAGLVVHLPSRDPDSGNAGGSSVSSRGGFPESSFAVGVDTGAFDRIVLSGTSMWASHLPGSYSAALLGSLHTAYTA